MNNDKRWKQRFQSFEKAIGVFQARIDDCKGNPEGSPLYEATHMALIQSFEFTFELAWKTLKNYLENEGYNKVKTPRQIIRQSFQDEIIREGEIWMEALEMRNMTSHVYHEDILEKVASFILNKFTTLVWELYYRLKESV